jgi:hypothetical protein
MIVPDAEPPFFCLRLDQQVPPSRGNLTTDAQIAAIAHRCRATVHTADTDLGRFPGARWMNPLLPQGGGSRQGEGADGRT